MIIRKTITTAHNGLRLDDAIATLCEGVSKSEARRIIDRGGCTINSTLVRVASRSVRTGDVFEVGVMEAGRFRDLLLPPEALLYEDGDLIAVNKPAGINTQRTPYQLKGTLEYWVTEFFKAQGSSETARVVHRLDRGTSGVMLFPKHRHAAAWLSKRFHDGEIDKRYLALVTGHPEQEAWTVDAPIGKIASARYGIVANGRSALTEFRRLSSSGEFSLVEAKPLTGRTHQIRVHLELGGTAIVGDPTYGNTPAERMLLHCSEMTLLDAKGKELRVQAPLDGLFAEYAKEFPR